METIDMQPICPDYMQVLKLSVLPNLIIVFEPHRLSFLTFHTLDIVYMVSYDDLH